jgi:ATP-dependent helicase/nuclease subunit A
MSTAIDPEIPQRQAADPTTSVWVAASAGTGKTKVLTDRVLSLLLAGAAPERLLCLTFTKAAAAEMANRIALRLAGWATGAEAELAADLARLTGKAADQALLTRARRLFARVLDTPGGLKIETIHAFCQSLLRRFPLEAGLAPHFQVMDDRDAGEMLATAREELLAAARRSSTDPAGPTSRLAEALAVVTAAVHETAFPDLMAELASERGRLRRLMDRHGGRDGVVAALFRHFDLAPGTTVETLLDIAVADSAFDAAGCRKAAAALAAGSAGDVQKAEVMASWLAAPEQRVQRFEDWTQVFLTGKGEIRARLATKAVVTAAPGTLAVLAAEAERLLRLTDRLRQATILTATVALITLAEALLGHYQRQKAARAMLDYDDLILRAVALLEQPGQASWVLFKLDGGIDHVLIDEAQDTNPEQWRVVAALTGEFFAGEGRRPTGSRTVFAVGDAKQSIYSFQRADPREFEAMRERFARVVPAAQGRWAEVALSVSFRSAPAVLAAVDRVINSAGGGDGVTTPGHPVLHVPYRAGAGGLVELWPPTKPAPRDDPEPWKPPVERLKGDSPRARLAQLVARRIQAMIDGGEMLQSRGRPIRAGDVLVLVRRRNAFVEELVRELKTLGVAVAGADRMVLTEQLAVMDLMALANCLLLPEDDLTLATVLKGPLIGLAEEDLFTLAFGRSGSLWEALRARTEPIFLAARDRLAGWMALADQVPPHDLFSAILADGGKQALLARLGLEAIDPLDEFITLTLAFERAHPPSLQGFLRWLEEGGVEIKRDLDQGSLGAVRIMTVHGAKGLQAPIVFLPDTMQVPTRPSRLLWLNEETDDELLVWPPRAGDQDGVCRAAREAANHRRDQEYRRLLYVALTRAEDRLYIAGWETRRASAAHCWYNVVETALADATEIETDPFLAARLEDGRVRRLRSPQSAPVTAQPGDAAPSIPPAPPAWVFAPAPEEPSPPRPLTPSRPDDEEPPIRSPFGTDSGARFRRGRLVHRLLQTLPDVARHKRAEAAARFLGRPGWSLPFAEQAAIAQEITAILDDPAFAPLFGPGSLPEVPVVGLVGERILSGQVDRLVVTDTDVLVVDYKTNRPPPRDPRDVAPLYLRQMAAYRTALSCIYPGKRIRCALLWTDGPRLMPLDGALLDDALALTTPGRVPRL